MKKTFVAALVMIVVALVPACKSRKTPPPVVTATVPDSTPPDIPPPPEPMGTAVAQPTDFVRTDEQPREDDIMPSDIEALNRHVQQRGFIRDAFFNYDESTLDDAAQAALSASATWLKSPQGSAYKLLVEGHCDERGTEQYNLALGDRRANIARDYLVTLGVDANRIRTVSYGEERPFEEGHDDSAWAQNRRAHLVLVR